MGGKYDIRMLYGSVKGIVNSISLTTNSVKTAQRDAETYSVTINFPEDLRTNFRTKLNVKYEVKGSADIITNDRSLMQRFFGNLKCVMKK